MSEDKDTIPKGFDAEKATIRKKFHAKLSENTNPRPRFGSWVFRAKGEDGESGENPFNIYVDEIPFYQEAELNDSEIIFPILLDETVNPNKPIGGSVDESLAAWGSPADGGVYETYLYPKTGVQTDNSTIVYGTTQEDVGFGINPAVVLYGMKNDPEVDKSSIASYYTGGLTTLVKQYKDDYGAKFYLGLEYYGTINPTDPSAKPKTMPIADAPILYFRNSEYENTIPFTTEDEKKFKVEVFKWTDKEFGQLRINKKKLLKLGIDKCYIKIYFFYEISSVDSNGITTTIMSPIRAESTRVLKIVSRDEDMSETDTNVWNVFYWKGMSELATLPTAEVMDEYFSPLLECGSFDPNTGLMRQTYSDHIKELNIAPIIIDGFNDQETVRTSMDILIHSSVDYHVKVYVDDVNYTSTDGEFDITPSQVIRRIYMASPRALQKQKECIESGLLQVTNKSIYTIREDANDGCPTYESGLFGRANSSRVSEVISWITETNPTFKYNTNKEQIVKSSNYHSDYYTVLHIDFVPIEISEALRKFNIRLRFCIGSTYHDTLFSLINTKRTYTRKYRDDREPLQINVPNSELNIVYAVKSVDVNKRAYYTPYNMSDLKAHLGLSQDADVPQNELDTFDKSFSDYVDGNKPLSEHLNNYPINKTKHFVRYDDKNGDGIGGDWGIVCIRE